MSTVLAFALVIGIGVLQHMSVEASKEGSPFASLFFSALKLAAMVAILVVLTGLTWWVIALLVLGIEFVILLILTLAIAALETL